MGMALARATRPRRRGATKIRKPSQKMPKETDATKNPRDFRRARRANCCEPSPAVAGRVARQLADGRENGGGDESGRGTVAARNRRGVMRKWSLFLSFLVG